MTDVRAPRVDLLDSSVLAHVRHLNESGVDDVDWDDCLDVAVDSLYDATSGNFSFLRQVMSELVRAVDRGEIHSTPGLIVIEHGRSRESLLFDAFPHHISHPNADGSTSRFGDS